MTITKNTLSHTGEKKTPKNAESTGNEPMVKYLRAKGREVIEVPADDSVKVRIPFPRKK